MLLKENPDKIQVVTFACFCGKFDNLKDAGLFGLITNKQSGVSKAVFDVRLIMLTTVEVTTVDAHNSPNKCEKKITTVKYTDEFGTEWLEDRSVCEGLFYCAEKHQLAYTLQDAYFQISDFYDDVVSHNRSSNPDFVEFIKTLNKKFMRVLIHHNYVIEEAPAEDSPTAAAATILKINNLKYGVVRRV